MQDVRPSILAFVLIAVVAATCGLFNLIKANTAQVNVRTAPTVVVFTERDCPYCKALRPGMTRLSREGYPIAEVDVASAIGRVSVQALRLTKVPVVVVFDPDPKDFRQMVPRASSPPQVVLKEDELRALLRRESIPQQVKIQKTGG